MRKHLLKLALGSAAVIALAACGDNDNDVTITPPPGGGGGGDPVAFEDNFGAGFATAFQADANDDPIDPMAGDIVDIDPTADPLEPPM